MYVKCMRLQQKSSILRFVSNHLITYGTPANLSYMYNWGSLAGIVLGAQIVTGILLGMHYVPQVNEAFSSVVHIMHDVPSGMILRYSHANGASLFFVVVYAHILRSVYYNSWTAPRGLVWLLGVVILLVMIITAFIGYVLPWGQMSLWGATVITSLVTVIPVVGNVIVSWLWGGFSIDQATLNRFYSLHFAMPFALAALSIFHIAALHQYGSSNPAGINAQGYLIPFGTYFGPKDMLGLVILLLAYAVIVFFYPEVLGHPDNWIPANPYSTPAHIVPEWYFLWVYAVLRSIPSKAGGVLVVGLVFAGMALLPYASTGHQGSPKFRSLHETLYWIFAGVLVLLTWVGQQPIEPATMLLGQVCTVILLFYLFVLLPHVGLIESLLVSYYLDTRNATASTSRPTALLS
jgi:ubiquinol-cytochrome c reductase cytochrome b subunit